MATDTPASVPDTETARAMLEESLPRLAKNVFKVCLILFGFLIFAEIIHTVRMVIAVGFGDGLLMGALGTIVKFLIVLIVLRITLLPLLNEVIYAALLRRGELQEVELKQNSAAVSDGFRSYGTLNYMVHGAVHNLEILFGCLLPMCRVHYRLDLDDRMYESGFLYPDETPVLSSNGKGLVLVDPQNGLKRWLVRRSEISGSLT